MGDSKNNAKFLLFSQDFDHNEFMFVQKWNHTEWLSEG